MEWAFITTSASFGGLGYCSEINDQCCFVLSSKHIVAVKGLHRQIYLLLVRTRTKENDWWDIKTAAPLQKKKIIIKKMPTRQVERWIWIKVESCKFNTKSFCCQKNRVYTDKGVFVTRPGRLKSCERFMQERFRSA